MGQRTVPGTSTLRPRPVQPAAILGGRAAPVASLCSGTPAVTRPGDQQNPVSIPIGGSWILRWKTAPSRIEPHCEARFSFRLSDTSVILTV